MLRVQVAKDQVIVIPVAIENKGAKAIDEYVAAQTSAITAAEEPVEQAVAPAPTKRGK